MSDLRTRKRILGICACLPLLGLSALSAAGDLESRVRNYKEFQRLGAELGLSLDRSVTWKGLSHDSDFDELANLTKADVELCVQYIAEPARTRYERYVAGFSAYKLAPPLYASFIRRLLVLRERGVLSTIDLVHIANPPVHGVPDVIYDNYQRPEIQQLIRSLLALPDLPEWARNWFIFESDHGGYYVRLLAWLRTIGR